MKIKVLLTATALFAASPLFASIILKSEDVGGITWHYGEIDGVAKICNGIESAISINTDGAITIPSTLGGCPVKIIGSGAFANCVKLTGITIPNSVTNIESSAFICCTALTSLTIPSSVRGLGDSAFKVCVGLESVKLSSNIESIGEKTFYGCSSLKSVSIPWGVTSIGKEAFQGCTSVTNVTIQDSVTTIGKRAFFNCNHLTSLEIPASVTQIGVEAFGYCTRLASVEFYGYVPNVADDAFELANDYNSANCIAYVPSELSGDFDSNGNGTWKGLVLERMYPEFTVENGVLTHVDMKGNTSATIPGGVTSIGDLAFQGLLIKRVRIPDSVTSIGYQAFVWCSQLDAVTIPASVTSIGSAAFCNCVRLKDVRFEGSQPSVGTGAFGGVSTKCVAWILESKAATYDIVDGKWQGMTVETYLPEPVVSHIVPITPEFGVEDGVLKYVDLNGATAIEIPGDVTAIDSYALYETDGLESVSIPGSVKSIGAYAFGYCTRLASVTLASGVTTIGAGAFSDCWELKNITIPASVTAIGDAAFAGSSPAWIAFEGRAPQGSESLSGVSENCIVRIPWAYASTYEVVDGEWQRRKVEYVGKPTTVTVTFDANGGKGGWSKSLEVGAKLTVPTVTRTGCKFAGWDKAVAATVPSASITYKAKWKANAYTVKFNANGGTGKMSAQKRTYDDRKALTANAFKRAKHSFRGWATAKGGSVKYTDRQVANLSSKDGATVTLYAVWGEPSYTVKFFVNDGTKTAKSQTVKVGAKTALTKAAKLGVARAGWEFKGWAVSASAAAAGTVKYKDGEKVTNLAKQDKTASLYAVWSLPAWATGTFYGDCECAAAEGVMTVKITAAGALTGTMTWANGKNKSVVKKFTASAPAYTASYAKKDFAKAFDCEDDGDLKLADGSSWTYGNVKVALPKGGTSTGSIVVANCKVVDGKSLRAGDVVFVGRGDLEFDLAQDLWTNAKVKNLPNLSKKPEKKLNVKNAGSDQKALYQARVRKLAFAFADKGAITVTALDANGKALDKYTAHLLVDGVKGGKYLGWTPVYFKKLGRLAWFGIDVKQKSGAAQAADITLGFDD